MSRSFCLVLCLALTTACTSQSQQWENADHDIQAMKVSWMKDELPKPISRNPFRYGRNRVLILYLHHWITREVLIENEMKRISQGSDQWLTPELLIDSSTIDNNKTKALQLAHLYEEYSGYAHELYGGETIQKMNLHPDYKSGLIKGLQRWDVSDNQPALDQAKKLAHYYRKMADVLQSSHGTILRDSESGFRFSSDQSGQAFKKDLNDLLILENEIKALAEQLASRRTRIISESFQSK